MKTKRGKVKTVPADTTEPCASSLSAWSGSEGKLNGKFPKAEPHALGSALTSLCSMQDRKPKPRIPVKKKKRSVMWGEMLHAELQNPSVHEAEAGESL